MKKQLLIIFTGSMELGGIERSLLGMLDSIDYKNYDVDLFLYGHHGPLFHLINRNVNLLPEIKELAYLRESFYEKIKHKAWYSAWRRIIDGFFKSSFDDYCYKVLKHSVSLPEKEYDMAISFFQPFDLMREFINAKIKIGWIHTDYSFGMKNKNDLYKIYYDLNYIAAVSDACKNTFNQILPEYQEKTIVVENCLSVNYIRQQATAFSVEKEMPGNEAIKLLSIGRFCEAKNFDNVPDICRRVIEKGINIVWYLIGFGTDENLIRKQICANNMQNNVIILGKKENPYPYIEMCDWYIQPSRFEGKSVTVREAQVLHKPVIITDYATATSQLIDGYDGVIVPQSNKECAEAISMVLKNCDLKKRLIKNTYNEDYSNKKEILKLYALMEADDSSKLNI